MNILETFHDHLNRLNGDDAKVAKVHADYAPDPNLQKLVAALLTLASAIADTPERQPFTVEDAP